MIAMRVVAHLLVFVAVGLGLLVGLGLSHRGTSAWGDLIWIVAAALGMINLVWIVRGMMKL